jgi:hypothetical protein
MRTPAPPAGTTNLRSSSARPRREGLTRLPLGACARFVGAPAINPPGGATNPPPAMAGRAPATADTTVAVPPLPGPSADRDPEDRSVNAATGTLAGPVGVSIHDAAPLPDAPWAIPFAVVQGPPWPIEPLPDAGEPESRIVPSSMGDRTSYPCGLAVRMELSPWL